MIGLGLATAGPLAAGQGSWTSGGPEGGEVTALAVDLSSAPFPNRVVYAATRLNGVFRSADGGTSWSAASSGLERRVASVAVASDGTVYAIADRPASGVFKSTDGGASWVEVLDLEATSITVDPSAPATVYVGTADEGVWKTVNGGSTWTASTSGLTDVPIRVLAVDPLTPATVYAGTATEGVYKSLDGGGTWDDSNQGIADVDVGELAIDPATPATLYAGSAEEGMFKSIDSGAGWSAAGSGLAAGEIGALAIDPGAPATLFAGVEDRLFRSLDGAASWQEISWGLTGVRLQALAVDAGSSAKVWAGSGAGVSRSVDGGTVWSEINAGLTAMFIDRIVGATGAPQTLYAASPVSGVFKSLDGGASWLGVNAGLGDRAITDLAISESQPQTLWAATLDEVYRTADGGASWLPAVDDPADFGLFGQNVTAIGVDPRDAETGFAGNSGPPIGNIGAGVYQTSDGGADWQMIYDPPGSLTAFVPSCVAFDPTDPDRLFVASLTSTAAFGRPFDYQVVRSLDGGAGWLEVLAGLDRSQVELAIHPLAARSASRDVPVASAVGSDASAAGSDAKSREAGNVGTSFRSGDAADGPAPPQDGHPGSHHGLLASSIILAGVSGVSSDSGEIVFDLFRSEDGGDSWEALTPAVPCLYSLEADLADAATFYLGCEVVYVSADSGTTWVPFESDGFPADSGGARELAMTAGPPPTLHAGTYGGVYSWTFGALADLAVDKDNGLTEVAPGAAFAYAVDVENLGPDGVTGATVSDDLPAELDCTWTCTGSGGGVCTSGPFPGDLEDLVDLPAGALLHYTADCTLDLGATDSLSNSAAATVPAAASDPVPGNSSATDVDVVLTPGACGVFEDRALSSMVIDTAEVFEACRSISAGPAFEIAPTGDVLFRAGERILLRDGFSVEAGGVFTVLLEVPALGSPR